MKFCKECESMMTKNTSIGGNIVFQCRCQLIEDGTPEDTLMAEGNVGTEENNFKHEVFIENAPFDSAANIVNKECPKCNLNYMTMIRIGMNEDTVYSCQCGYRSTHSAYISSVNE